MSKSQTKKITKWKASHQGMTRTEFARQKKLKRLEKLNAKIAEGKL